MEVRTSTIDEVVVMSVAGKIDALTAESLTEALLENIQAGATQLITDLSGVNYISSAGLRSFLRAQKEIRGCDGDLRLAGVQPNVLQILQLSGFTSIFKMFDDTETAVDSFNEL
jgi:anti-sigma B factor antagonist